MKIDYITVYDFDKLCNIKTNNDDNLQKHDNTNSIMKTFLDYVNEKTELNKDYHNIENNLNQTVDEFIKIIKDKGRILCSKEEKKNSKTYKLSVKQVEKRLTNVENNIILEEFKHKFESIITHENLPEIRKFLLH